MSLRRMPLAENSVRNTNSSAAQSIGPINYDAFFGEQVEFLLVTSVEFVLGFQCEFREVFTGIVF